jgi:ribosomal protein S18 acetylase RimI-like enzyme
MNNMVTIKSLDNISFDILFNAFNEAFSNYEVQVNKEELNVMLNRRGYVPKLSFGAFDNNKLISFTLNGIGVFNTLKTAYDTGTGTIKEYRGKGIASEIFEYSLPFLRNAGISQYLLEVIQHNTHAVSVYKKLGFTVSREFNYYSQIHAEVRLLPKFLPVACHIKEIKLEDNGEFMPCWDFVPSWQNSFDAILRSIQDYKIIGAYEKEKLIGYCIFEPVSGDVTQIAINKNNRRQGIASVLLKEALKYNKHDSVKVINIETTCEVMTFFLEANGILLKGKQFEMIKKL